MDELTQLKDKYRDVKLYCIHSPAYGSPQNLMYVVRPDGYIGFIGDTTRVQELRVYMDQLLSRTIH